MIKRKVFANLKKYILIFEVPVIFLKWKPCRVFAGSARMAKYAGFFKLDKYNYCIPDRQHSAHFQKSIKISISLLPMVHWLFSFSIIQILKKSYDFWKNKHLNSFFRMSYKSEKKQRKFISPSGVAKKKKIVYYSTYILLMYPARV